MNIIKVIKSAAKIQEYSNRIIAKGKTIALVPTMGFLHKGHLVLMREGRKCADELIASIFVNPTQFGPGEDLESYPRNIAKDIKLLEKEGVNVLFNPDPKEIYPEHFQTYITLEKLPKYLCGITRSTHFRGVATVVAKLFNIVKPNFALFGQKDYQQLAVLKQMARDLNFDIKIIGIPTVREPNGLALSSRNTYLRPEQRSAALTLNKALNMAQTMIDNGIDNSTLIINAAAGLIESYPANEIDYISICNPETLVDIKTIYKPVLMALAVKVGKTRLIDNMILFPHS